MGNGAVRFRLVHCDAMARVLAVANQKGGVAKTTTVHALGVALARLGDRVLLVDLDPQACLTFSVGLDPDELGVSLHDVLVGRNKGADAVHELGELSIIPSSIDLAGTELFLLGRTGREHALARALEPLLERFDTVLIDCPPSLGVLTVNGLTAAHEVVIPLQCEALAHRGVGQLLDTMADVRTYTNPSLGVRGVIATMFDSRTRHGREVIEDAQQRFGLTVLEPPVPKSVRFAEAPARGVSILDHASSVAWRGGLPDDRPDVARRRAPAMNPPTTRAHRLHAYRARPKPGERATRSGSRRCSPRFPRARRPPLRHRNPKDAAPATCSRAPTARPGTLVVDCAHCARRTRVSYAEFAALHFPVWLWLPIPTRSHRHWLRCPACHHFAWLRAGWLE